MGYGFAWRTVGTSECRLEASGIRLRRTFGGGGGIMGGTPKPRGICRLEACTTRYFLVLDGEGGEEVVGFIFDVLFVCDGLCVINSDSIGNCGFAQGVEEILNLRGNKKGTRSAR